VVVVIVNRHRSRHREAAEMGKEEAAAALSSTVVLAVNGKRYEAAGVDPWTSLLEFLRTQTPVRGPKLGCGEGMCVMSERHC
jgi:xanthine dehydrogenase iron-sulfur cluster and FAD-binding subunit A